MPGTGLRKVEKEAKNKIADLKRGAEICVALGKKGRAVLMPGSENGVDGAPRPRPPSAPPASSAASVGSIGAGLTAR